MQRFCSFRIGDRADDFHEIVWLKSSADWDFVRAWENSVKAADSQSLRDSLEYAQIAAKRWIWLLNQEICVAGMVEIKERFDSNPDEELGFALAVVSPHEGVVAFCYVRRLWLNHLYLEFLATVRTGAGSLLLYALGHIAQLIGAERVWGECTQLSQGFYRRIKARFIQTCLENELSKKTEADYPEEAQWPGAVADHFIFGRHELEIMAKFLKSMPQFSEH